MQLLVVRRRGVIWAAALVFAIWVLHASLCGPFSCGAGAIRILPPKTAVTAVAKELVSYRVVVGKRPLPFPRRFAPSPRGLIDSKRKVPSCPDPLHN